MLLAPIILCSFGALHDDPRVDALIAKMTIEEKAGQLGVFSRFVVHRRHDTTTPPPKKTLTPC